MTFETLIQHLLNALSLGSIYALLALGLAVVYSVLKLLNFAYGELITSVGYTMFLLAPTGIGFWLSGLIGIVVAVVVALLTEVIAFRPLRKAPPYAVIFASFALSFAIQAIIRNFITPKKQLVSIPGFLNESLHLGTLQIPVLTIIYISVGAIVVVALTLVLKRTKYGLAIRAAAESFPVTRLMGAKAGRMMLLAFVISGLLAGIAGLLWIARSGSLTPDMGFTPLLEAFIAVVLGGLGSLTGAVYGGFLLAFIEVALRVFLPSELGSYVPAFALVAVVAVLYFRPNGFVRVAEGRVG